MSRVLIAGVCIDVPQVVEEAMEELAALDEQLAVVARDFDSADLIMECLDRVLNRYRDEVDTTVELALMDRGERIRSYNNTQFRGVVKPSGLTDGLAVGVHNYNGQVQFYRAEGETAKAADLLEQEFVNLMLSETLLALMRATGHEVSELSTRQNSSTGKIESISFQGVSVS